MKEPTAKERTQTSVAPPDDSSGGGKSPPSSIGPGGEFWEVARPHKEPLSTRWFLPSVVAVLIMATPWYLPSDVAVRLWHGLPFWVWNALLGAVALGGLTSYAALVLWRDEPSDSTKSEGG